MKIEYRFVRTKNNITGCAGVALAAEPAEEWSVRLFPALGHSIDRYREAIRSGVATAIEAHKRRDDGARYDIEVTSLIESLVDTMADTVEVASAIAARRAFGHAEKDAVASFVAGRWQVSLTPLPGDDESCS